MKHAVVGNSMSVTDSVKRAMEHLKDRPMPNPKADHRQNYTRKPKPAPKTSDA